MAAAHAERLHEERLNKVYEEMHMKIEHYRQVEATVFIYLALFLIFIYLFIY